MPHRVCRAAAFYKWRISIWQIPTGKLIARFEDEFLGTDGAHVVAINPATDTLALHDFVTGKVSAQATLKGLSIQAAKFSHDGKTLGTLPLDDKFRIWNAAPLSIMAVFSEQSSKPVTLQWKPDGTPLY